MPKYGRHRQFDARGGRPAYPWRHPVKHCRAKEGKMSSVITGEYKSAMDALTETMDDFMRKYPLQTSSTDVCGFTNWL